jgi:hypothetical protein
MTDIRKRIGALTIVALLLVTCGCAPSRNSARSQPDARKWAYRNIGVLSRLLRQEATDEYENGEARASQFDLYFFSSVKLNPMLLRDPYAAKFAEVARQYREKAGGDPSRFDPIIEMLGKPESERTKMMHVPYFDGPDERPASVHDISRRIMQHPAGISDETIESLLKQMEIATAEQKDWGALALAYKQLAFHALNQNNSALSIVY